MSTYGHDYVLRWPVEVFAAEARVIGSIERADRVAASAEWLLEEAFSGPQPRTDMGVFVPQGAWDARSYGLLKSWLRKLADEASEFPTVRRRYWATRNRVTNTEAARLSRAELRGAWLELVVELDNNGYLDRMAPSACTDGSTEAERCVAMAAGLSGLSGVALAWPPPVFDASLDGDLFFTYIEVVHDCVARPRTRDYHDYGGDYHYGSFGIETGQSLYRWRVNELLSRTALDLRLADDGDDCGLLVHTTDLSRADLVARVLESVDDVASDPVARAVAQFRARGANRLDKQSACRALAHELEPLRDDIKEHLLSGDERLLFETANRFAIRHNRADQHDDYQDEYLDWLFWVYLATVELLRGLAVRTDGAGSRP
jgi:hypothetical protein